MLGRWWAGLHRPHRAFLLKERGERELVEGSWSVVKGSVKQLRPGMQEWEPERRDKLWGHL